MCTSICLSVLVAVSVCLHPPVTCDCCVSRPGAGWRGGHQPCLGLSLLPPPCSTHRTLLPSCPPSTSTELLRACVRLTGTRGTLLLRACSPHCCPQPCWAPALVLGRPCLCSCLLPWPGPFPSEARQVSALGEPPTPSREEEPPEGFLLRWPVLPQPGSGSEPTEAVFLLPSGDMAPQLGWSHPLYPDSQSLWILSHGPSHESCRGHGDGLTHVPSGQASPPKLALSLGDHGPCNPTPVPLPTGP